MIETKKMKQVELTLKKSENVNGGKLFCVSVLAFASDLIIYLDESQTYHRLKKYDISNKLKSVSFVYAYRLLPT